MANVHLTPLQFSLCGHIPRRLLLTWLLTWLPNVLCTRREKQKKTIVETICLQNILSKNFLPVRPVKAGGFASRGDGLRLLAKLKRRPCSIGEFERSSDPANSFSEIALL